MRSARTRRLSRVRLVVGLLGLALIVTTTLTSLRWIGATFPGFFVMANGVIPSIALPEWAIGDTGRLFQHQVLAVDGAPVESAEEVYRLATARPPGSAIVYRLRSQDGAVASVTVRSRTFSRSDFVLLFGAYLVNGIAFLAIGLLVSALKPGEAASRALLVATATTSLFVVTAADLYGPHWFFRLHVLGECFLGAAFLHLALVFPTDRIRRHRRAVLTALYAPFVVLAAWYESVLDSPSAYTTAHLVASAAHGFAGLTFMVVVGWDFVTTPSPLVRRRIGVVAVGAFAGLLVPVGLMSVSALFGGSVPLNAGAVTAFLFPLAIGYAIVQRDLFEIDVMLRRALTYAIVVATSVVGYLALLAVFGAFLPERSAWSPASIAWAALDLAMVYLVVLLRTRVQAAVDRLFLRTGYDPKGVLAHLGQALASARSTREVGAVASRILGDAFWARSAKLLVRDRHGVLRDANAASGDEAGLTAAGTVGGRLRRGEIVARYEWDDGSGRPLPPIWQQTGAELLVPIVQKDRAFDLLLLGAKGSGRPYDVVDLSLLQTAASQVALALSTAGAFAQLATLNAELEAQVKKRTSELAAANEELNDSLDKLRAAYRKLETSQQSLARADRLATLGRLTAGIAHELNTPLGGVLNALKLLTDLGREYEEAIDDPEVGPEDHREIAREIVHTSETAAGWARKAASFVSRVKVHGREPGTAPAEPFPLRAVVEEIQALLAHRLRTSGCRVVYREEPAGLLMIGAPARLGQVLTNLIGNALDAYEERGMRDGRVEVAARREDGRVVVTVADDAGGIPPDVLPHVFDELFTTKEPGRGTGLGLWIARNLVEQEFGGSLTVASEPGAGSTFTAVLHDPAPRAAAPAEEPAPATH